MQPERGTTPLFDVPGVQWTHVSRRLATLRRLVLLGWGVPAAAVALFFASLSWSGLGVWAFALAEVLVLAWLWYVVGRRARAWRYAERADDLLVSSGLLIKELIVVPYGRMQFVDVTSGPLERRFGLAGVRLYTAAARTTFIPGLPAQEAARLRDELAARGEAQAAGL